MARRRSRTSPSRKRSGWLWSRSRGLFVKICVFGAGAIGGYLAVELALAGHEVCVIARGAHLQAIQDNGLKLLIGGGEKVARVAAAADPQAFGPQRAIGCVVDPACEVIAPGTIEHLQFNRFWIGEPDGTR